MRNENASSCHFMSHCAVSKNSVEPHHWPSYRIFNKNQNFNSTLCRQLHSILLRFSVEFVKFIESNFIWPATIETVENILLLNYLFSREESSRLNLIFPFVGISVAREYDSPGQQDIRQTSNSSARFDFISFWVFGGNAMGPHRQQPVDNTMMWSDMNIKINIDEYTLIALLCIFIIHSCCV